MMVKVQSGEELKNLIQRPPTRKRAETWNDPTSAASETVGTLEPLNRTRCRSNAADLSRIIDGCNVRAINSKYDSLIDRFRKKPRYLPGWEGEVIRRNEG